MARFQHQERIPARQRRRAAPQGLRRFSQGIHPLVLLSRRRLLITAGATLAALGAGLLSACGSTTTAATGGTAASASTSAPAVAASALTTTTNTSPSTGSVTEASTAASKSASAPTASGNTATASSAKPSLIGKGKTSLLFLTGWAGSDGVTMTKMLTTYVTDHPDVTIDFQALAWNDMFAKLDTMLVAGTAPELIAVHRTEVPQYGSRGSLQTLDSWYAGQTLPKTDFSPTVLAGITWQGKMLGVPLDMLNYNTYVNTDPLRRAGLDATKMPSGVDFLAQASQLSHDQADPQKATFALDGFGRNGLLAMLYQYDADFLSPDGTNVTINAPAAQDALQAFNDMIYKSQVYPAPALKLNPGDLIKNGRLAYRTDGDWDLNFYTDNHLQPPTFAALPFPQLGPKPAIWINSHVMAMPVDTKGDKADAVKTLITWISDHGLDWAHAGHVPARLSQQQSPTLKEDWAWSVRVFAAAAQAHGRYEVATPRQSELRVFEDKLTADIQLNNRPVKAIIDDYASQIKGMLAQ
jgi:multiple sugar transport system substrate-binding protein